MERSPGQLSGCSFSCIWPLLFREVKLARKLKWEDGSGKGRGDQKEAIYFASSSVLESSFQRNAPLLGEAKGPGGARKSRLERPEVVGRNERQFLESPAAFQDRLHQWPFFTVGLNVYLM